MAEAQIQSLNTEEQAKLRRVVDAGVSTLQRIADEKEAMNDLVKTQAEELGIPAKVINDAIKAKYKSSFEDMKQHVDDVGTVLTLIEINRK